jgi:CubicO group peptidase (beta-lactamase class C family)
MVSRGSRKKAEMFVSRRRLLQGSLLSAATMAQGPWPALAEVTAASPTADERTRMAALATDFMKAGNIPGLSIAIAIKGTPVYVEGFGVADRETPGQPFANKDDVRRIADGLERAGLPH